MAASMVARSRFALLMASLATIHTFMIQPRSAIQAGVRLPISSVVVANSKTSVRAPGRQSRSVHIAATENALLPHPPLVAEAIGTGIITFFGTGVVASTVYLGAMQGLWQVAIVWGAAVALAAYATASISGAHLNPAVTLAMVVFKGFPVARALRYALAQLAGATVAASGVLAMFYPAIKAFESSKNIVRGTAESIVSAPGCMFYSLCPGGITSGLVACVLEAVQQAVLTFVILSLVHRQSAAEGSAAPALIGLTVAMLISVFGPLTMAGFNPARDVGPRIVAALAGWGTVAFKHCWVYVVGPLIGTLLGGAAHRAIYPA